MEPGVPGVLIAAPEVETFTPCGTAEPLWREGPRELMDRLRTEYRSLAATPYGGTFAILVGEPGPPLDCGFCEDYAGSFRFTRIVAHEPLSERSCP
ncbi:MAG: hypothetical protein ACQGVC_02895 [Myxococcota bacterium]